MSLLAPTLALSLTLYSDSHQSTRTTSPADEAPTDGDDDDAPGELSPEHSREVSRGGGRKQWRPVWSSLRWKVIYEEFMK